ncbi:hypothetical protein [Dactylosporangium sp. NPDC051541]|uniref:hypothetical protein n=1 Tax=Dactylosporangium sp. NPDC051541 TaxID=3363977 RepID=UPI00378A8D66
MTAAMYELPDDNPELQEAVETVESGRIVILSRDGRPAAALTPLQTVVLARKQAVDDALAASTSQLDAATMITQAAELMGDAQARGKILEPLEQLLRHINDGPSIAIVRLALALQHYEPDALVTAFDWARHLPQSARAEMLRELEDATHANNPNPPSIRQVLIEWEHTAEAYADPDTYAALTAEHADHGEVPVPGAA